MGIVIVGGDGGASDALTAVRSVIAMLWIIDDRILRHSRMQ